MTKKYEQYVKDYGKTFKFECSAIEFGEISTPAEKQEQEDAIEKLSSISRPYAANPEHPAILIVTCIQASTFFNKNDHYFIPSELWKAKATGKYMLADWNHNREEIIGCISDTFAINNSGELMKDDEEVDDETKFDIGNEVVVWAKYFEDYAEKIRESYSNDKLFVSMECAFDDFDFAVQDIATGSITILARNEETDFLTDNLKMFGGKGLYQNHKIGPAFRDFSFVGVGFCENPANPRSVVTDVIGTELEQKEQISMASLIERNQVLPKKLEKTQKSENSGVIKNENQDCVGSLLEGEKKMDYEKLYGEAKSELEKANASLEVANKESKAAKDELEKAIASSKDVEAKLVEKVASIEKEKAEVEAKLAEKCKEVDELCKDNSEKKAMVDELSAKLGEIELQKKNQERKASVEKAGLKISDEELFAMSDDAFAAVIKYMPAKQEPTEEAASQEAEQVATAQEDVSTVEGAQEEVASVQEGQKIAEAFLAAIG